MAPMTRNRATHNHISTYIMVEYYGRRSSAGLIITEGTAPSIDGVGYARISGLYNQQQIDAWKKITDEVHKHGGKIFVQLMHTGRVSHKLNMPSDARIVASSAIGLKDDLFTDQEGMVPSPVPTEMIKDDIAIAVKGFVSASRDAMVAGFDGVELHAANGYLIDQFTNLNSNQRTDEYGGNFAHRARFLLEVVDAVSNEIRRGKIGVRLSPYGVFNGMGTFSDIDDTYKFIAKELNKSNIAYMHLIYDLTTLGASKVPDHCFSIIKQNYSGLLMLNGGFSFETGNETVDEDKAELISFGRPFIANPDLVKKFEQGLPLDEANPDYFYTPGVEGYL